MSDAATLELLDALREDLATGWASVPPAGRQELELSLAGMGVRIEVAGTALAGLITPALEVHRGAPSAPPALAIRAWDCAATGVPMPPLTESLEPGVRWRIARDGGTVHVLWDGHQCLAVDLDAREARVAVADADELPWWERGAPLRQVLTWAVAEHGRRLVHVAAVGRPAGVLLLGAPGGHGKSSTAVSALLAGHHFLGDDLCLLTDDDRVHPLYGTVKVAPDQLPILDPGGRLAPHVIHDASAHGTTGDKTIAVASRVAPELMLRSAPVAALVVPSIDGPPGVDPISPAIALRQLAPTSMMMQRGDGSDDLAALAAFVRRTPCFRLGLSPDRAANPIALAGLLDDLGVPAGARPHRDPA